MKRKIIECVHKCLTCQKVKVEHKRRAVELRPLEIPIWKWDSISIDFVIVLPLSAWKNYVTWAIIDRLTKFVNFIPSHDSWGVE